MNTLSWILLSLIGVAFFFALKRIFAKKLVTGCGSCDTQSASMCSGCSSHDLQSAQAPEQVIHFIRPR
ncbi:MAG: hypothetical protein SOT13_02695 [Candidatus Aphodousia sp.]|nr:hypothetical protein [Sutterella sp.]MDY2899420.1 hypothetical protein [Candidatus Aphodousia sp.]